MLFNTCINFMLILEVEVGHVINVFDFFNALDAFEAEFIDTPPSSLMDSTASPKMNTTKGKGIRARSLAHNTSGVEWRAGAPRWD
jgi:hypothetical protein